MTQSQRPYWIRGHRNPLHDISISDRSPGWDEPSIAVPARIDARPEQDQLGYAPDWYPTVHLFSRPNGRQPPRPAVVKPAGGDVRSVTLSNDGAFFAYGAADRFVTMYDLASGRRLWDYTLDHPVTGVALSGNGLGLAAVDRQGGCWLFCTYLPIPLWQARLPDEACRVAADFGANRVAVGSAKGAVYLLDRWGRTLFVDQDSRRGPITGLAIDESGSIIAATTESAELILYRTHGDSHGAISLRLPEAGRGVAMTAHGEYIAAATASGTIILFDHQGRQVWQHSMRLSHECRALAMTRESGIIVIGCADGQAIMPPDNRLASSPARRPADASEPSRWMARQIIQAAFDTPHHGMAYWFGMFSACFERQHDLLIQDLFAEIQHHAYPLEDAERLAVAAREAEWYLVRGLWEHLHTGRQRATPLYERARALYQEAALTYHRSDLQDKARIVTYYLTNEYDHQTLRAYTPSFIGDSVTLLQERMKRAPSVAQLTEIVQVARDVRWTKILSWILTERHLTAHPRIQDPTVRAAAIIASERMDPGLSDTDLLTALADTYWVVRWRAAATLRARLRDPAKRAGVRSHAHALQAGLQRETHPIVKRESVRLLEELT